MTKLIILLALIATIATFAQAPQGFNYQATVRNSSGQLLLNQIVLVKFNVLQNSANGAIVYSENQSANTDDLGQINLVVGQGTATTGTFSTINWGTGNYYLGIELNTGSGYIAMGTTQLLSVPYALYANSSGNSNFNFPNGTNIGDTLNWIWNGTAWVPTSSVSTAQLPVISTIVATILDVSPPSSGGAITSDGGYSITSKGVCWSTSPNPTINDNSTNNGTGASNFTSILSNLLPTTTYYYRAYATNSIGTGYGITYTFTTTNYITTWQTTNLDVTTYRDGTPIPQVTDPTQWAALTTGAWCYYNNTTVNGTTYGKLYNWYAVAGIHDTDPNTPNKKLAPTGYHVPTDAEWTSLTTYLGGETIAVGKMKSTGTTLWTSPNTGATNSSGFTGLPGGYRSNNGTFYEIGGRGGWWSSSEFDARNAWHRRLFYNNFYDSRANHYKENGFSVRCLRD
jgi:uncharacterized protein (TIGR02145 family)